MIKCYRLGDDGDKEWLCEHGIGHSEHVHTCDGCCSTENICSDEITCEEKENGDLVLTLPHSIVELLINRVVLDALKDYIGKENL